VPQGGHLSPLLFLLFINDLDTIFKNVKRLLFADDLKLYLSIGSLDDCVKLQDDLNGFLLWCVMNDLDINISKCQQISFTRRRHPIKYSYTIKNKYLTAVSSVKDLGIWFTEDLSFTVHLDKMYKKSMKVLGFKGRNSWEL